MVNVFSLREKTNWDGEELKKFERDQLVFSAPEETQKQ
jgi:hypothetical protein